MSDKSWRYIRHRSRLLSKLAIVAAMPLCLIACPVKAQSDNKDVFAHVNGVVITRDEYIRVLEKQQVVANSQPTAAVRLALDTIIGNQVILAEAARLDVLPLDVDVERRYALEKRLFEEQAPDTNYEDAMRASGATVNDVRKDLRIQLAETNLYAKLLKIGDDQVRKTYDAAQGKIGLPERAQFRLIVVFPNSPESQKVKRALAMPNANFDRLAGDVNLTPTLRSTAGLQAQMVPLSSFESSFQDKVKQTPAGKFFGPVDFVISQDLPKTKAWIKIEKKRSKLVVSYEDAAPLVRRQLMQMQIMEPANANIRTSLLTMKVNAAFEPADSHYIDVWKSVKKAAIQAGVVHTTEDVTTK